MTPSPAWIGAGLAALVVVSVVVAVLIGLGVASAARGDRDSFDCAPLWRAYLLPAGLLSGLLIAGAVVAWAVAS